MRDNHARGFHEETWKRTKLQGGPGLSESRTQPARHRFIRQYTRCLRSDNIKIVYRTIDMYIYIYIIYIYISNFLKVLIK